LALVDLGLPDGSGISVIEALSLAQPDLPIMVISAWSDENRLFQALEAGANGYLLKERDDLELLLSLRSIIRGGSPIDPNIAQFLLSRLSPPQPDAISNTCRWNQHGGSRGRSNEHPETIELTSREQYILNLVSLGLSNQEIADDIEVSRYTVETHIRRLYRKLAVSGRTKALHKAKSMGLI
jgi:DNA-binding NarL/FixJ family response regulator